MYLVLVPDGRNVRVTGRFFNKDSAIAEARALIASGSENDVEVVEVIKRFR